MTRILIIDDDPVYTKIVRAFIRQTRFADADVLVARSMADARMSIEGYDIDLVILDNIVPPYEDFRELLGLVTAAGYQGPFIVVSGEPPTDFGQFPIDRAVTSMFSKDRLTPSRIELILSVGVDSGQMTFV